MKLFGTVAGDPSVGIRDIEVVIDFVGVPVPKGAEDRQAWREGAVDYLRGTFADCSAKGVGVRLEDECEDCGRQLLDDQRCGNAGCVRNWDDGEEEAA